VILRDNGVEAIRVRSLQLTRLLIERAQAAGFRLNTPLDDRHRAGAVIIDIPDGQAVSQQLIHKGVIVDYRPGAGIRIAPHFYNTEQEIDLAMTIMVEIASAGAGRVEKTSPK
jgi:kynureninase